MRVFLLVGNSALLCISHLLCIEAFANIPFRLLATTSTYNSNIQLSKNLRESISDTEKAFSAFADALDEDAILDGDNDNNIGAVTGSNGKAKVSWQESVELLLDPTTPQARRQILISDLLNANDDIRKDIQDALKEKKIDNLLTPTGKKLQEGTRAVARQITTDIFPNLAAAASSRYPPTALLPEELPRLVPKIGSTILDAFSNQAKRQLEILQADLADPRRIPERISKQAAELATEAKNVFLETPEGLVGPRYTVVSKGQSYEIRDYESYTVASTSMSKIGEPYSMDDIAKGGAAFNALAAYLFGGNDEGRVMDMTTPVSTTSMGEMRFYLKKDGVSNFPQPLLPEGTFNEQGAVKIVEVPPARLAVKQFTGFVTEGEVARQKDALLSALALDGVEVDAPHGAIIPHVILQYNPPYTIPIIRRNEIAIPVISEEGGNLGSEWQTDFSSEENSLNEQEIEDDIAPSDVE